jgi:ribosome-binding factor A
MASEKRQNRVAEQIRKDLGQIMMTEHSDLFGVMTLSEVRLSTDLSHASVFVSIMVTDKEPELLLRELKHRSKSIRKSLASRLRIRAVPLLRFLLDESLDRVDTVNRLIAQMQEERDEIDAIQSETDDPQSRVDDIQVDEETKKDSSES